ncbi:MAG: hypothetical protein R2789_06840 [Microthrixaceae bacterium]
MTEPLAEALAEFRAFNYEHIYMRPDSLKQSESVIRVLRALVEHYLAEGSTPEEAVGWVGDRPLRVPPGAGAAGLAQRRTSVGI